MLVVSGTKIADEIGTGRSEVWRLIQQLRELGVEIAGHPATGYRLEAVPDLLLPNILDPLLRGTMFAGRLHHFFRTGSTNAVAMQTAAQGEPEGAAFLAEEQTSGRGRGGHSWESQASVGVYASMVFRPPLAPADALLLSLVAGLAVSSAIESVTTIRPDLRWPNDVMLGDRKFCGILTELNAEVTRVRYAVVGIGINVNHATFPAELEPVATSLRLETGRDWSRVEVAAALLKSLDREYRVLLENPREARESIYKRFDERSSYARGREVHVEEDGGYDGITEGLDERGFLQVRTPQGLRTVLSGGVRARRNG
jgi:BirA family biotin operon repressor/biotin-[acetyl-CoA-carboxylase] ligase